jgi:hypothetical protein
VPLVSWELLAKSCKLPCRGRSILITQLSTIPAPPFRVS